MTRRLAALLLLGFLAISTLPASVAAQETSTDEGVVTSHGIAMHGEPLSGGLHAFRLRQPGRAEGRHGRLAAVGSFDSFNPFTLKGRRQRAPDRVRDADDLGNDEPFTEYGLLAETIEVPADRSWVAFTLRPEARWHDGKPITADDVIFSFETSEGSKGHPFYRAYYTSVAKAEKLGEHRVQVHLRRASNRELPLISASCRCCRSTIGKAATSRQPTLEPPLGSGPTGRQLRGRPLDHVRSASRTTGARTCRSTSGQTTSA